MEFKISDKAKKIAFGLIGIGLIATVIGFLTEKSYIHTELDEKSHELTISYPGHHTDMAAAEADWKAFLSELETVAEEKHISLYGHAHHGHDEVHGDHEGGEHEGHNEDHGHEAHGDHGAHHGIAPVTVTPSFMHTQAAHDFWGHAEPQDAVLAVKKMIDKKKVAIADHHHGRFWANLLVNSFFFFGICLGALFYYALHYATESGWGAYILRIFEAIFSVIPFGSIMLIIVFLAATFGVNHIYHWMDPEVVDPTSPHFDKIIFGKSAYLNKPFWWIRTLLYIGTFVIFAFMFRKWSRQEDEQGGTALHFKQYRRGALFLVFFAVFSSTLAWDWIMSIDTHWFSTLFGWYVFSGVWISAMIVVLMTMLYMKSRNHMPHINQSHIHDVAKWVFAISFLWSYLWFSQFMLIWYSDIPEEVTYYVQRINDYKVIFFTMFAINFILPMVLLMSRDAKRTWKLLIVICSIAFVTHWVDVYMLVMPGTVMNNYSIGILEIGMFLLFLGIFLFALLRQLTKAPLVKKNHPMLDESIHHDF